MAEQMRGRCEVRKCGDHLLTATKPPAKTTTSSNNNNKDNNEQRPMVNGQIGV
jgi:hypothetical protein